jgi:hypothetical protein
MPEQKEVRWSEATARAGGKEDPTLKAAFEELTTALRKDPKVAEALEKVTQSAQLRGDWSCCRGV